MAESCNQGNYATTRVSSLGSYLKVINFWAGPGAGKSTTAAGVFSRLKQIGYQAELVTEYAKDLTWEGRHNVLADQLYVTAKQNRKLQRLVDHNLDYVVTDSPVLLGYHYSTPDYLGGTYRQMLFELWNGYDNLSFFIRREKKYNPVGRNQTEQEAREIDDNIRSFLNDNNIPFQEVPGIHTIDHVIDILTALR